MGKWLNLHQPFINYNPPFVRLFWVFASDDRNRKGQHIKEETIYCERSSVHVRPWLTLKIFIASINYDFLQETSAPDYDLFSDGISYIKTKVWSSPLCSETYGSILSFESCISERETKLCTSDLKHSAHPHLSEWSQGQAPLGKAQQETAGVLL